MSDEEEVVIYATNNAVEANALATRLAAAGFPVSVRTPESALTLYLGSGSRFLQHFLSVPKSRETEARAALAQLLQDAS